MGSPVVLPEPAPVSALSKDSLPPVQRMSRFSIDVLDGFSSLRAAPFSSPSPSYRSRLLTQLRHVIADNQQRDQETDGNGEQKDQAGHVAEDSIESDEARHVDARHSAQGKRGAGSS